MTRQQFDDKFAAHTLNTEGYTQAQLDQINDLVFEATKHFDADPIVPDALYQAVQVEFEIASRRVEAN